MSTFDLSNANPASGDKLRDEAANLLSYRFPDTKIEKRARGKKVDVFFATTEFKKTVHCFVEAKDYKKRIGRKEIAYIWSDYSGIIKSNRPATLLLVTRSGLTTDAQEFVSEIPELRHLTIWELENECINLSNYLRHLHDSYIKSGLDHYYTDTGFKNTSLIREKKNANPLSRKPLTFGKLVEHASSACTEICGWVDDENDNRPIAVLGGYGAGKSSLARRIAALLSEKALEDPLSRRPILIELGNITRYSNVQGLLGGYFTSDFLIKNFSVSNFMTLNEKGRFVIILDGFDEMKHAMNWSDFRRQIESLLEFQNPKSKIIMMGRPNAFLNEIEERQILRGERPFNDKWITLPNWPEFYELELNNFGVNSRKLFVEKYLQHLCKNLKENNREVTFDPPARTILINKIADLDPELFSKPVHAKLLTELATNPNFEIEKYEQRLTRWDLYNEFLNSIFERENDKEARQETPIATRIEFLETIAYWLWTEKDGVTSFSVDEIPEEFFSKDLTLDFEGLERMKRELLSGSLLEKKSGDIYYFGHRSFAEFLVAQRMIKNAPRPHEHLQYSTAFIGGVKTFVEESASKTAVANWLENINSYNGDLRPPYLRFLLGASKDLNAMKSCFLADSLWGKLLAPFEDGLDMSDSNLEKISQALNTKDVLSFSWWALWILSNGAKVNFSLFAISIIRTIFKAVEKRENYYSVGREYEGILDILQKSMRFLGDNGEKRSVKFETKAFIKILRNVLSQNNISPDWAIEPYHISTIIKATDIGGEIQTGSIRKFISFSRANIDFRDIVVE